jgi:hypothetical protein
MGFQQRVAMDLLLLDPYDFKVQIPPRKRELTICNFIPKVDFLLSSPKIAQIPWPFEPVRFATILEAK